jgi:hypothetical protein
MALALLAATAIAGTPIEEHFAGFEARLAQLERENGALKLQLAEMAGGRSRRSASVSPLGVTEAGGRQLGHASPSATCCRWTPDNTCGDSIEAERYRKCTLIHEYLEGKTTTHEFENLEHANCLGADSSKWTTSFNGHTSNVTLSNDGNAVSSFKTPLKVTHAENCGTVAPALTLQMDTTVDGDLKVQGWLTQTLSLLDGSSVMADITMRHLANSLMFDSGRKLYIKNAQNGRYLKLDNSGSKVSTSDPMTSGGHEKVIVTFEMGKNLDQGNRRQHIILGHNEHNGEYYGHCLQMNSDHVSSDNGWGLATAIGTWERFQIYIPDSGGVINSHCNHPGAAYIYNPHHDKYVECSADGKCWHSWNFGQGSDVQKCDAAWYFHYAETAQ